MWDEGFITINHENYQYHVKHFSGNSIYGIDNGKISKLEIRKNNVVAVHYDRGWITRPVTDIENAIYEMLIKLYN